MRSWLGKLLPLLGAVGEAGVQAMQLTGVDRLKHSVVAGFHGYL